MDIRKFFSPPSGKKKSQHDGDDDDDDFIKSHPKRKSSKKKGVLFVSDSSDEDPIPRKVRKQLDSSDIIVDSDDENKNSKAKHKLSNGKKRAAKKENLQETTPKEFFSNFKSTKSTVKKRKASDEIPEAKPKVIKKDKYDIDEFDDLEEIIPKPKKKSSDRRKHEGTVASKLSAAAGKHANGRKENDATKSKSSGVKTEINKQDYKTDVKPKEVVEKSKKVSPKKVKTENKTFSKSPAKPSFSKQSNQGGFNKEEQKTTPEKKSPNEDNSDPSSAKKARFMKYKQWQNRAGPSAPGSKEVPKGKDYCFEGMTFVVTGIQESLSREDIRSLIERYGGKVTGAVSSRTKYLITGTDAGESKIKKAEQHRTKIIDEDEFLDLLRTLPGKKSKYEVKNETSPKKTKASPGKSSSKKHKDDSDKQSIQTKQQPESHFANSQSSAGSQESVSSLTLSQKPTASQEEDLMWVDKYKPKTIKQIIGQQGASSNMQKLLKWLRNWYANHRTAEGKAKPKPKINQWGGGDPTGASLKAALLSGPPGVGKTTTATLVCQELGLPFVELNASDTRSKRTLKEDVAASVQNTSISNLLGKEGKQPKDGSQHVLIMDEVDGMAGNEDRGGMQELIQIIKTTKIPIICMCNDRSSQKMRSLTNHCFDLRFQRPRVEQITSAIMSICYKEGIKVQAPAIQAIIRGCNQDIRQVLHNLNIIKANNASLSYDDAKSHADKAHKDVNLGIFEIARKLLSSESANLSLLDKSNLFFMDYSMVPKFIQENYLHVTPFAAKGNIHKHLNLISKAADSIACGDMIEASMRHDQSWSMLPTLGLMSAVLPCDFMRGGMQGMINFPSFFGKLSTTTKNHRLLQELKFHSSVSTSGCTEETFNYDIVPYLRWHLSQPLLRQSQSGEVQVHKVTQLLDDYDLTKDDFDSLMEVGQYQGKANYMSKVDSKVKAAFTRTYNKESHLTPYAVESAAAKKKKKVTGVDMDGTLDDVDAQESDDDDVGGDGMIKQAKKKAPSTAKGRTKKTNKEVAGTSKRGKKK